MSREELLEAAKEAARYMTPGEVYAYLIDWCERAFFAEMAAGLQDEAAEAAARNGASA